MDNFWILLFSLDAALGRDRLADADRSAVLARQALAVDPPGDRVPVVPGQVGQLRHVDEAARDPLAGPLRGRGRGLGTGREGRGGGEDRIEAVRGGIAETGTGRRGAVSAFDRGGFPAGSGAWAPRECGMRGRSKNFHK